MTDSILDSIKEKVGIKSTEITAFDSELIMDINMAIANLTRIGVGPERGFRIEDRLDTWDDFLGVADPRVENAKEYIALQTKLIFDSNAMSGAMIDIYKQKSDEILYTLSVTVDPDPLTYYSSTVTVG